MMLAVLVDFPEFLATCNKLESEGVCENGVVNGLYAFYALRDGLGRTVQDACCVVDGGLFYPDPDAFEDKLLGWEINIYGHEEYTAPAPSADPSVSPTMIPSVPPSTVVANSGSNSSDLHGGLLLILLAIWVGGLFV
jgi:hypothetical protein